MINIQFLNFTEKTIEINETTTVPGEENRDGPIYVIILVLLLISVGYAVCVGCMNISNKMGSSVHGWSLRQRADYTQRGPIKLECKHIDTDLELTSEDSIVCDSVFSPSDYFNASELPTSPKFKEKRSRSQSY